MGDRLGKPGAVVFCSLFCMVANFGRGDVRMGFFFILHVHQAVKMAARDPILSPPSRQRPYHIENTSSRPITEVKQCWARSVLGWVTAWEHRVQLSFALSFAWWPILEGGMSEWDFFILHGRPRPESHSCFENEFLQKPQSKERQETQSWELETQRVPRT